MNWLFRRHFWILHLVFLAFTALIVGRTASTLAGFWLAKKVPEKSAAREMKIVKQKTGQLDFTQANERNIFSARREKISFEEEEEMLGQIDPGNWEDAGPSNLPLKLISTMVFMDPFSSRAVILDTGSSGTSVHSVSLCEDFQKKHDPNIETVLPPEAWEPDRPCAQIGDIATVKRIEEYRVYIFNEREKKYEYLSLSDEKKRPVAKAKIKRPAGAEEGAGIRKVGATSYEIDQSELDRALANVAKLMTEARAVPESDGNGNYVGFKIVYIKSGSLFEKIGIERMDVLTRVNGYELNSPEKALQLFSKLRFANQFTIDLERGGRSVTLDYSVAR